MPEYTVLAVASCVLVVLYEMRVARTGLFSDKRHWIAMSIVLFFMVLSNGWLTKLSAPIVMYNPDYFLGIRYPFDIPVEDFLFGFALVTLTLIRWRQSRPSDTPQLPRN